MHNANEMSVLLECKIAVEANFVARSIIHVFVHVGQSHVKRESVVKKECVSLTHVHLFVARPGKSVSKVHVKMISAMQAMSVVMVGSVTLQPIHVQMIHVQVLNVLLVRSVVEANVCLLLTVDSIESVVVIFSVSTESASHLNANPAPHVPRARSVRMAVV